MKAEQVSLREIRLAKDVERLDAEIAAADERWRQLSTGHFPFESLTYFQISPEIYASLCLSLGAAEEQIAALQQRIEALTDSPRTATVAAWRKVQARHPGSSSRFRNAIRQAVVRGHDWNLTPEEYEPLVVRPCSDCGGSVGNGIGLDRLNHRLGYSADNVRPCCGACNVRRGRKPLPTSVSDEITPIQPSEGPNTEDIFP